MDVGAEIKGQYKVVEHIGRGGMADVWSARDTRLNRMVAIKTIAHGLSPDTDPVSLFQREAQTIAQLEHPHILPIYDFGEYQGQLYIVMRFVTGGSLEDLLNRGALPANEVLRIGEAIAQALDYAHTNNVIHLDLKPPNILLDSHNTPYLADFGLATVVDREGRARNPGAGTLLYMAPEQLTADVLDNRADIYSFSVMLYHMLTGQLPFDSQTALALRQLQFQEELPDIDRISEDLPAAITSVLRRGTALHTEDRPSKLKELMDDLRDSLMGAGGEMVYAAGYEGGFGDEGDYDAALEGEFVRSDDVALLEAVDLYSRARHVWAAGRGRFLLGVTHFMLMNGYYMDADKHGLSLDVNGMQMLLRGALEYDHEVNFWWDKLDDANRRWVCLHAIRSANAPTRIRALYRLETLPDADPPQIPKLVAQALQVETNQEAKIAALQVLGTRAKLLKPTKEYDVKTEYRGRLLTTMTRIGVQLSTPSVWIEAVYSPEIDLLVAQTALDQSMPSVADFAARTIGRMRSLTAARYLARQQRLGAPGALRALALVRDEAPTLPNVVSPQGRLYAWLANTWRRTMTDRPLGVVWRYIFALLGAFAAMGFYVYSTFRSEAIFNATRIGLSLAVGLVFAVFFVSFLVLFSDEFSRRLRGFWPWWGRLILSVVGIGLGTLTWAAFTWFYLNYPPPWDVMFFAGTGLALGFVLSGLLSLRGWIAVPLTAFFTYAPLWLMYHYGNYTQPQLSFLTQIPVLYFDFDVQIYTVAIPFVLLVAFGGHAMGLAYDVRAVLRWLRRAPPAARPLASVPGVQRVDFAGKATTTPGYFTPGDAPAPSPNRAALPTEFDPQRDAAHFEDDAVDEREMRTEMVERGAITPDKARGLSTEFDPMSQQDYHDEEEDE
jgi:serine/threonine protein kinase